MVSPILLVAVPLGAAFLLPMADRLGRPVARGLHLLTLLFAGGLALRWLAAFQAGAPAELVTTGGWPPPIGISLRFGVEEAVLVLLAAVVAFVAALHLARREQASDVRGLVIQLLLVTGSFGLIMTRDLFNVFVFLEISSIATYAVVAFGKEREGLEAGFKYMVVGSAASIFVLLGIALLYKATGTLNLDDMLNRVHEVPPAVAPLLGGVLLLLATGFLVETKMWPFNGPAIDLYDGVEPGVMALVVGTVVNAVLWTFWKVMLLAGDAWVSTVVMTVGMVTFVVSNFLAIRQDRVRRMLGYSSSAQLGLLVFLLPLVRDGHVPLLAAALLLVNHTLAKAALLWLAGLHGGETMEDWAGAFRGRVALGVTLLTSVVAITGLPPFPGFWGKWEVVASLARSPFAWWILPLLLGSLFEFVYYFGWLRAMRPDEEEDAAPAVSGAPFSLLEAVAPLLMAGALLAWGLWWTAFMLPPDAVALLGLGLLGLVLLIVPGGVPRARAGLALAGMVVTAWLVLPMKVELLLGTFEGLFGAIVLLGGILVALAGLGTGDERQGHWGLLLVLVASSLWILRAETLLAFFAAWEIMTWSSWLLVRQGRRASRAAWLYILFGAGGGLAVLGGFAVAMGAGVDWIRGLGHLSGLPALAAFTLLAAGFLAKAAAWGLHVWAPGAYSESPDTFTPFLSGVVSKLPVFALMTVAVRAGGEVLQSRVLPVEPLHAIAWIGGLTALGMTLLAVFQEDMKRLLAYSSVGQVAYAIVGFAILSPLGWSAALYQVVNHFLFKTMLFLAIAGVVYRTGARRFSQLGGLITRMPVSFVVVLVGIIAVSGVPPLSGFAAKWLLYQALMEKGWFFLTAVMMFASVVAFPYLFRLIHSIFLGQLRGDLRETREAPWPLLAAQLVLLGLIMGLSVFPGAFLAPVDRVIAAAFGGTGLHYGEWLVTGPLGYLSGPGIMALVMALFVVLFLFLFFAGPRPVKVKQLDIVYAGEVPPPPEQVHVAYDMFRHYKRAWEPVLRSWVVRFWNFVGETADGIAETGRKFYTGNGQTYLLYTLIFLAILGLAWVSAAPAGAAPAGSEERAVAAGACEPVLTPPAAAEPIEREPGAGGRFPAAATLCPVGARAAE